MLIGLNLFSGLIAPFILVIIGLICLLRLKSRILSLLTLSIAVIVLLFSDGTLFVFFRNPYIMFCLLGLVVFNSMMIPVANDEDRPYLIAADTVLLLMMIALHGWRLYLRQSDTYITEQSAFAANSATLAITSLTLIVPILWLLARSNRPNQFRYSLILITLCIMASLIFGLLSSS